MHMSGVENASYVNSRSDLRETTDRVEPTSLSKSVEAENVPHVPTHLDNNVENLYEDIDQGCTAVYRRFLSDWRSILTLLFLYTLQGLPLGLIISIPLIIQERSASYNQQAKFSLAGWPFSIKLLWAPLVDALYVKRMGRRKSWLIPVQYLIGLALFVVSYQVDHLIDTLQIGLLTAYFFFLNFLTATQDIAVDGWALTMLKRENVGLASTCNAIGQSLGIFIGHVVFLNLASKDFSNKYFRSVPQDEGIVTLSSFMAIWSLIYFISTTLILLLKREGDENNLDGKNTIYESYMRLYKITKLPAVRMCVLFYLTKNIGLAAVNGVSDLKLVEAGLPKETKALLSVPLIPIGIILPVLISRWTAGHKPMGLYMKAFIAGLLLSGVIGVMVWITGEVKTTNLKGEGSFPTWYMPLLLLVECVFKICKTAIFVTAMAFNARISDPEHGSTFMTLYNTIDNFGTMWPVAIALWLVDPLTITKACIKSDTTICEKPTIKVFDGYYTETIACIVIGGCWFFWGWKVINKLQKIPEAEWRIAETPINNRQQTTNNDVGRNNSLQ